MKLLQFLTNISCFCKRIFYFPGAAHFIGFNAKDLIPVVEVNIPPQYSLQGIYLRCEIGDLFFIAKIGFEY